MAVYDGRQGKAGDRAGRIGDGRERGDDRARGGLPVWALHGAGCSCVTVTMALDDPTMDNDLR